MRARASAAFPPRRVTHEIRKPDWYHYRETESRNRAFSPENWRIRGWNCTEVCTESELSVISFRFIATILFRLIRLLLRSNYWWLANGNKVVEFLGDSKYSCFAMSSDALCGSIPLRGTVIMSMVNKKTLSEADDFGSSWNNICTNCRLLMLPYRTIIIICVMCMYHRELKSSLFMWKIYRTHFEPEVSLLSHMKYALFERNELDRKIARRTPAIIRWHVVCAWRLAIWKWRYAVPFVEYVMHTRNMSIHVISVLLLIKNY